TTRAIRSARSIRCGLQGPTMPCMPSRRNRRRASRPLRPSWRWSAGDSKKRRKTMPRAERTKTREENQVTIEPGSGNVFADLGLKTPEELLAKAELVQRIGEILAERKLTQTRAAALLGIDQPKVSALMRGKLDGFSLDRLFRFLNALGRDVDIVIRPARHQGEADTRVTTA